MRVLGFVFAFLLLIVPCIADIIVVEDDGSGDYPTIQAAIDSASTWDIIEVQPGTYTGNGNRDIDFKGKAITLRSIDPNNPDIVAATIIDCEGTESTPHRGFHFYHNEDANSILAGLTITNGYTTNSGGAIRCIESSPTITHCDIIGNTTGLHVVGGAGINCLFSGPMITNCKFINNVAKGKGDGAGFRGSNAPPHATINNCVFIGNSAYRGGAIHNCSGPINNCVIINNKAIHGGGIHSSDGPITNCIISGNLGVCNAGGLDYCNGPISNCVISGNSARYYGGGGLAWCNTTITNCIIAGNSADQWGGGILDSSATIRNCVIVGNLSGDIGGGIAFKGNVQNMEIINSIIWNNEATYGGQIAFANESEITLNYCDIAGGKQAVHGDSGFTLNWGIGNIDDNPNFVDPGYWDQNDTPDDTNDDFWVDGDYHLKSEGWRWNSLLKYWDYDEVTSRCIDSGNPGTTLADELRTVPDDPANLRGENIRTNMGAYGGTTEASMPPYDWTLLADLTNDGITNLADFTGQAKDWQQSESEKPGDLNRDGTVDIDDITMLTEDWLKETSWAQPLLH